MGLVLGVEAAIGIAEAVEAGTAAAEAGEAITGAAEAGEAIEAGATAGGEAGAEAGGETSAAASEGGEALSQVLSKLQQALQKINKMVTEFLLIDAGFKAAKAILEALTSDPAAQARARKLSKLINVLNESSSIMKNLSDWLNANAEDTTSINDITVTMQGILSKFLPHLASVSVLDLDAVHVYTVLCTSFIIL